MLHLRAKWNSADRSQRRRLLIWLSATFLTILLIFIVIMQIKSQMPLYMIGIRGMDADTPSQAQRLCREEWERFADIKKEYPDCEFVWCGTNRVYMLLPYALDEIPDPNNTGFETVSFYNTSGIRSNGYVIHPELPPQELGIIDLVKTKSKELTFDTVSMSVRIGIRSGDVEYEDAIYLWEEGSRKVFVVNSYAISGKTGELIQFTDDGGTIRNCYILDTLI